MIKSYDILVNPEIRFVYSIDPGFRTSGFTFANLETGDIEMWSSKANDKKIQGVPYPELFNISAMRSQFYIDQIPEVDFSHLEIIIEHTALNLQFSTSLSVLISTFCSFVISESLCARLTFVPPKTSHWIINNKRKTTAKEMKDALSDLLPDYEKYVRKGYKVNQHTIDSLLFFLICYQQYCESKMGLTYPEIKRKKKFEKGHIHVT